jgi:DNA-binding NarL/FixJ family response regulator
MQARSKAMITALVEGDHFNRICDALKPHGIEVVYAPHINGALEASPNVVVCDTGCYGSWRRVIRQILELRPEARVVLLSRTADDRMWVDALSAGAYDLLPHPCSPKDLCATVLGALGTHRYSLAA